VTKHARKIPLGKRKRTYYGSIKWIYKSRSRRRGVDSSSSWQRQVPGFCENDNEPSGSVKCG